MEQAAALSPPHVPLRATSKDAGAAMFFGIAFIIAASAALLAGWAPLGFSIVIVFLFAGVHNWLEFRYFLAHMPAHWGPLRAYFLLAIGGAVLITTSFALYPVLGRQQAWDGEQWSTAAAALNSALILWLALLVHLRGGQIPGRDWSWVWAPAFLLVAGVWIFPHAWDLGLVYLHPLIALWFLDRELKRNRPQWRRAYRTFLCCVPLFVALLAWQLGSAPALRGDDMLSMRIIRHSGAEIVEGVSSHLLVALHTFLELLHYGVWVFAIPVLCMKTAPWQLQSVPLCRRSRPFKTAICMMMGLGGLAVVALWGCFIADYPLTRDVYFTVAMLHVLAEFPFLLRTL